MVKRARQGGGRCRPQSEVALGLDTSTAMGSVAVWCGGLAAEESLRIQGAHSERVLPSVHHLLAAVGVSPHEVSILVVGSGPGSFTGVRIAAALAKGWSMARATSLFAYPSLLAVVAGTGAGGPVCAMFDARRGQVYAACYEIRPEEPRELLASGVWHVSELLDELHHRHILPAFAGDGALLNREAIQKRLPDATVLPETSAAPRAAALLWLQRTYPELGHVADPQAWEPLYVRDWKVEEDQS